MIFSNRSTSAKSISWCSSIQFGQKLVSSPQKFINDFIQFKLIIPNIIKIVEYYLIEFRFDSKVKVVNIFRSNSCGHFYVPF